MKETGIAIVIVLFGVWGVAAQQASSPADEVVIQKLVNEYFSALSNVDRPTIERCYLPKANISGLWMDPQKGVQLATLSVPDFISWYESEGQRFEYIRFRVLKMEVRRYKDMAQVRAVTEVREKEKEKAEEVLHSLDQLHLFRHNGHWRIAGHAWTMEAPDAPFAKLRLR